MCSNVKFKMKTMDVKQAQSISIKEKKNVFVKSQTEIITKKTVPKPTEKKYKNEKNQ